MASACGSGTSGASGGLGNGLPGPAQSSAAGGGIGVVAAENVWGDVARQVGGAFVSVTSLIHDPNQDPHEFESNVADAGVIAHARLVVRNGAGYDDFMSKLLGASPSASRSVITVADVAGVHGSDPNPHLWYRVSYVRAAAQAIAARLATIDPPHAANFAANLDRFLRGEQQVADVEARIRARHAGTPVAYTERVAGYLVEDSGLRRATPLSFSLSLETGNEPSPVDQVRFQDALTHRRVAVLIENAQVSDDFTAGLKALAARHGVPVLLMSETLPPDQPDLQSWQTHQAQALLEALGG